MTDVEWSSLRPILQDMADRIARIERFLAASGLQAPSQGAAAYNESFDSAPASFDSVPASFGAPSFDSPGQVAAAAHGMAPGGGVGGGEVPPDIVLLARSGKLIQAIHQYRKMTGMDLKQAKAIVEQASIRGY